MSGRTGSQDGKSPPQEAPAHQAPAPFARAIGRSRYIVLIAVAGVLLVAACLFVVGAVQSVVVVWGTIQAALRGDLSGSAVTIALLEVVSLMLKAVVFYVVGVGLYSLFIAPLNVTASLGVENLDDLEARIVGLIIVLMAVTFLEHFVAWEQVTELLQAGVALALVVTALVLFQFRNARSKSEVRQDDPQRQLRAERELFEEDREQLREPPAPTTGTGTR